jgi:hypothetical protein
VRLKIREGSSIISVSVWAMRIGSLAVSLL